MVNTEQDFEGLGEAQATARSLTWMPWDKPIVFPIELLNSSWSLKVKCTSLAQEVTEFFTGNREKHGLQGGGWDLSLTWLNLGSYSTWPWLLTCRMGDAMASVRSKPSHSLFMMVWKNKREQGDTGHPATTLPSPPQGVYQRGNSLARDPQTHLDHSRDDEFPSSSTNHQLGSLGLVDQDGGYHTRWWPLTWNWGHQASPTPPRSTTHSPSCIVHCFMMGVTHPGVSCPPPPFCLQGMLGRRGLALTRWRSSS